MPVLTIPIPGELRCAGGDSEPHLSPPKAANDFAASHLTSGRWLCLKEEQKARFQRNSLSSELWQCFFHPWCGYLVFGGKEPGGEELQGAEGDVPAPNLSLSSPLAHKGLFTGGEGSLRGCKYPQINGEDPGYSTCPQLGANGVGKEFTGLGSSCLSFMSGFQGTGSALLSSGINEG